MALTRRACLFPEFALRSRATVAAALAFISVIAPLSARSGEPQPIEFEPHRVDRRRGRRQSRGLTAVLSARTASFSLRRRLLVDAVSLDVEAGRTTVFIGPNGAGKSTLIRLMSGELRPTSGAILCEDEDLLASRRSVSR